MKMVSRTRFNLLLSILGLLAAVCGTDAQTFTLIADNSTQIPGGTGTFSGFFDSRAIEQGTVAFIGFGSSSPPGIYSYENGQLSVIADTHTIVPGTTTTFLAFNTVDLENSVTVFTGDWATGNQGVFQRSAQRPLRALATTITTGRKYFQGVSMSGRKVTVTGGARLVDSFGNHSESVMSIPQRDRVRVLLDTNTPKPEGGTFVGYDQTIKLLSAGLLFTEIIPNTIPTVAGIYELPHGSTLPVLVVNQQTPVPNSSGFFQGFLGIDWDGGEVAFSGLTTAGAFLYAASSPTTVRVIVDASTPVPGESANFLGVANPVAYEGGTFVFEGFWNGGAGLFTSQDGVIKTVVKKGAQLNGRTVSDAFCNEGDKGGNQLIARVLYSDNSDALYLVDLN